MDDEIMADMSDENVERIECRFVVGETVEFFYKRKWRPVTIMSVNNLIVDEQVKQYPSETCKSARDDGFDFFAKVCYDNRWFFSVLQTSKRLAFTNTHIREDNQYYAQMLVMMRDEPEDVQAIRHAREKHLLTAVHALHVRLARIRRNNDSLPQRAIFSTFVSTKTIDTKNIKPSGTKRK
jgi:hypothetical protein